MKVFSKIQTVETATKLSEKRKLLIKTWKEGFNSTGNTKEARTGKLEEDWNGLQFWLVKLVSLSVFQRSFFFSVWCNTWETSRFDTRLWFCHSQVISQVQWRIEAHYREKKSLRHVAMVAKFLDDNKSKRHVKSRFALFQTSSFLFNFVYFVKCWRNFLGWIRRDRI